MKLAKEMVSMRSNYLLTLVLSVAVSFVTAVDVFATGENYEIENTTLEESERHCVVGLVYKMLKPTEFNDLAVTKLKPTFLQKPASDWTSYYYEAVDLKKNKFTGIIYADADEIIVGRYDERTGVQHIERTDVMCETAKAYYDGNRCNGYVKQKVFSLKNIKGEYLIHEVSEDDGGGCIDY
jgi:hypothetical protein